MESLRHWSWKTSAYVIDRVFADQVFQRSCKLGMKHRLVNKQNWYQQLTIDAIANLPPSERKERELRRKSGSNLLKLYRIMLPSRQECEMSRMLQNLVCSHATLQDEQALLSRRRINLICISQRPDSGRYARSYTFLNERSKAFLSWTSNASAKSLSCRFPPFLQ